MTSCDPQRVVSHQDAVEHQFYSSAKTAEAEQHKRGSSLATMQDELTRLKKKNAKKLKVCLPSVLSGERCMLHSNQQQVNLSTQQCTVRRDSHVTCTKL